MSESVRNNNGLSGAEKPGAEKADLSTRCRLVEAAAREFNDKGFLGTDSNRIARAAGFAPQTFYRHFKDKTDIFLAAFDWWISEEYRAIDAVASREDFDLAIADIILEHHRTWQGFRKSLRMLVGQDDRVSQAKLKSFQWKLKRVKSLPANASRPDTELVCELMAIERLADAVTDGELADLGIGPEDARAMVAGAVAKACGKG